MIIIIKEEKNMDNTEQEIANITLQSNKILADDTIYIAYITSQRIAIIHTLPCKSEHEINRTDPVELLLETCLTTNATEKTKFEVRDINPTSSILTREDPDPILDVYASKKQIERIEWFKQVAQKPKLSRLMLLNGTESHYVLNKDINQIVFNEEKNKIEIKTQYTTDKYKLTDKNQIPILIEALQKVYGEKFTQKHN